MQAYATVGVNLHTFLSWALAEVVSQLQAPVVLPPENEFPLRTRKESRLVPGGDLERKPSENRTGVVLPVYRMSCIPWDFVCISYVPYHISLINKGLWRSLLGNFLYQPESSSLLLPNTPYSTVTYKVNTCFSLKPTITTALEIIIIIIQFFILVCSINRE
jgi:hypothetical protein